MQVLQVQATWLVNFDGGERLFQHAHQLIRPNLRGGAHVDVQLAAAADAVRAVAPLDVAEVQRGLWHRESVVGVLLFQAVLQLEHLPHGLVHDLQSVDPVGGIRAVAALACDADGLRHVALVGHHGHQAGGLTYHRIVGFDLGRRGDGTGSRHGGLFVGGSENTQRLAERLEIDLLERLHDEGEEALHVDGAEPVQAVALLGHLEGILAPAPLVEGHGIGMARQQQAAFTLAIGRHQVELAGLLRQRRHLAVEAELAEPVGQQPDHRLIALIPAGIRAADRGNRNNILIK
ncbi:hypothetical protein D3C78_682900 [compost metagenome]